MVNQSSLRNPKPLNHRPCAWAQEVVCPTSCAPLGVDVSHIFATRGAFASRSQPHRFGSEARGLKDDLTVIGILRLAAQEQAGPLID